jgi:hypothetical protein
MSLEVGNLLITMSVLGVVWAVLMIFLVWHPEFALMMLLFGGITYVIGRCWFLFIAWEEGMEGFFRCFIIPFYDWFYLYMNFDRYGRAFGVRVFGALTLLVSGVVYHVAEKRTVFDTDPPYPPAQVQPARPSRPPTTAPAHPEPAAPPGAGEKPAERAPMPPAKADD